MGESVSFAALSLAPSPRSNPNREKDQQDQNLHHRDPHHHTKENLELAFTHILILATRSDVPDPSAHRSRAFGVLRQRRPPCPAPSSVASRNRIPHRSMDLRPECPESPSAIHRRHASSSP